MKQQTANPQTEHQQPREKPIESPFFPQWWFEFWQKNPNLVLFGWPGSWF